MGAVIITTRSLLWVILTIISTLLVFTAVMSPKWLIGASRNSGRYTQDASIYNGARGYSNPSPYGNSQYGVPYGNQFGDRGNGYNADRYGSGGYRNDRERYSSHYNSIYSDYYTDDKPSVGLFNRCTWIDNLYNCANLASESWSNNWSNNSGVFPNSWKVALFFFIVGLGLMLLTVAMAVVSCCVQSCFKKSVFTLAGSIQTIAGLLFLLGLVIYMFGWGNKRVERLCGRDSGSFMTGDCSLGWAFYCGLFGIILTFITACLSVAAEKATSSDQISSTPKTY